MGFAESIDIQTNSIWIATVNTFHDVFDSDPNTRCISGVSVAQYNLDTVNRTYLPTGVPIQTVLSKDMQYGMLLANAPSQLPVLLTQITSTHEENYEPFNQKFIGNSINDLWMILTITSTPNPPSGNFPVFIDILGDPGPPKKPTTAIPPIAPGTRTVISFLSDGNGSLDPFLTAADGTHIGPYVFRINVMGELNYTTYFDNLTVNVEISKGNPNSPNSSSFTNQPITINVKGNTVLFVIPDYNYLPGDDPANNNYDYRKSQIQSYVDYVAQPLQWEQQVAVQPNECPKQFIISAYGMRGFQGSLTQLQNEVNTLANLGINTIMTVATDTSEIPYVADSEWPGLDVATVQDTVNKAGLKYRGAATSNPLYLYTSMQLYGPPAGIVPNTFPSQQASYLGYFDFYLHFNTEQLNDWARQVASQVYDSYAGVLSDVVEFHLVDEPNWFYGDPLLTGQPNTDLVISN